MTFMLQAVGKHTNKQKNTDELSQRFNLATPQNKYEEPKYFSFKGALLWL